MYHKFNLNQSLKNPFTISALNHYRGWFHVSAFSSRLMAAEEGRVYVWQARLSRGWLWSRSAGMSWHGLHGLTAHNCVSELLTLHFATSRNHDQTWLDDNLVNFYFNLGKTFKELRLQLLETLIFNKSLPWWLYRIANCLQ